MIRALSDVSGMAEPTEQKRRPLTADEVAEALNVSARTVRRLADIGALAAFRVGRQLRFSRSIVRDFIRRGGNYPVPGGEL